MRVLFPAVELVGVLLSPLAAAHAKVVVVVPLVCLGVVGIALICRQPRVLKVLTLSTQRLLQLRSIQIARQMRSL
jgi:hypothetical protein